MSIEASPDVIHTHQLNYKPIQEANCKYRFIRVPLNNITSSSVTVTATTSQLLEFKMPNAVYNLAQSFICYTETLPALASNVTFVLEDTLGLATNIYFGNASGADLCNLNYPNKYIKIERKRATSFNEYVTYDYETSQLYPSNVAAASNLNSAGVATTAFIEPLYLSVSASNTAIARNRMFNLGGVPNTIFSVDKDIYIPTDMYLRITAGPGNLQAFTATTSASVSVGAAALAADTVLTNIYLYLAVETNQLIIDSVINKVRTNGLALNIPYTTAFRNSSTGTVGNVNLPLSSQYGKKLKQILTTVWHGTETSYRCGDCANTNGSKIVSYNTYLNNRQLQDNTINTQDVAQNFNDWRENQRYAEGSVILNRVMYGLNWFHLDKFYEDNKGSTIPDENRQDGYDMNQGPVLHQLQATTANGTWIYYQFCSFSRDVVLNNQGFMYV